ncbi:MAG TPA: DinB family protein [Tepidiformaceae bacterium]|nr:DinB family protein [Tepidiformaceae bacterium]
MTHPMEAEFGRIRAYLQQQAAEKSVPELFDRVKEGMAELVEAARSVPAALLTSHPPGDDWAPLDCLRHAVQSNLQVAQDVLHVALTGSRPGEPEPELAPDRDALIAAQEASLESLWAHLSEAEPHSNLHVTWPHPFFGELNWREWLLFLRIHAKDHARQLTAMREALRA